MIEQQTISFEEILGYLDHGVTVVTGNNRLAGILRESYERSAIDKGLEVWLSPDILPWNAWLQRTWEDTMLSGALSAPEVLLTTQQEQCVWEDIIGETLSEYPLQQVTGTVRRVQEAWQLMQSWQLSLSEAAFRYNSDSEIFLQWASKFEAKCQKKGWLSIACLSDSIQRHIKTGEFVASTELVFTGFDELTPQLQSLLQTLVESGCKARWLQLAGKDSRITSIACLDVRQEASTIARWVRRRLDENPETEIGIVVPELESQRDIVIHALDEVLVPQVLHPEHQSDARPYNVSLGLTLNTYPIINTALKLLGLLAHTISLEDMSRLLRSPFIAGWEQEASARALLDGRLRETGELHVALKTLCYYASQTTKSYSCPLLAESVATWLKVTRNCPRTASPGQWSERFAKLLNSIGWASGRSLSSDEYQAVQAWQELLSAFATLQLVAESMTASAAVAQLRRMAGERAFQPQTGTVPVQVLGMLEANGIQFDYLWVMGLHDAAVPASPRPNPFIPLYLQRDAGLPHSSEERELLVARTMIRRILTSAAEVVVSYPQRNGDEELRPSPLIKDLSTVEPMGLGLWQGPTWRDNVHDSAKLTKLEEDPAPALENEKVRGGSAVFKLQAACPFRAFAELRLGARALGQADIGLDAMIRGSLMHRGLEKVWDALDSHEQLVAMDAAELLSLVNEKVREAIDEIAYRYPQTFSGRFREMEAKRLCRQVLEWLELEKQRVPFRVVEKEEKHEATAGGVCVQLKVDRIDELADSRQVVIDYKTGEVKPAQWFGDRPDEPQLPLYSMAVGGEIAGVLFAQVKTGSMAFNGVAEDEGLVPGVKSYKKLIQTREANSWSEVLSNWRSTMERLGEAFRNGEAVVDPKQYPMTCAYCELGPLCRINELTVLNGESSNLEDEL